MKAILYLASVVLGLGFSSKKKVFNVNLLIPEEYTKLYEQTHPSLGTDLMAIALALQMAFNSTTMANNNGYQILFELRTPVDNPAILGMTPAVCEGSVNNITGILNDINKYDNAHHYIALIPCPSGIYSDVFLSVGVDVPIIDYVTNIECSRRVAIFFEESYQQLYASFSNALLKVIGAPTSDYNTITESAMGDEGLRSSITINDNTVYNILNSKCFLSARGQ